MLGDCHATLAMTESVMGGCIDVSGLSRRLRLLAMTGSGDWSDRLGVFNRSDNSQRRNHLKLFWLLPANPGGRKLYENPSVKDVF